MAGKMKLKLNTGSQPPSQPSASPPVAGTPQLKLSLPSGASTQPVAVQQQQSVQKKSAGRKRQREHDGPQSEKPTKKRASGGSINFSQLIKSKGGVSNPNSPKTPGSAVPFFKLHTKAKPKLPVRPLGAGYDSEAEDAEEDPAMEENVVLRMAPGPDCDYLRDAITHGKVGVPIAQGGADVYMRFFKNRRAAIVVRSTVYAAVLVDLPCIVESMKSWDKRGWWKSADICQMLLVTGPVDNEAQAEEVAMPREVDEKTYQYPHGLTPPMYNVRKRRFRKRVNHATIEQAEGMVEKLLAVDAEVRSKGGNVEAQMVDLDRTQSQDASSAAEDEDAEGEPDYQIKQEEYGDGFGEEEEEEEDPEALAARMAAELADDGDEDAVVETGGAAADAAETVTHLTAAQAAPDTTQVPVDSANPESDEDDDDDDEEADEGNEEDQEQARLRAQQREEILDLQRDIDKANSDLSQAGNPIIRQRFEKRLISLREELASKKRSLGEDPDDE